MSAHTGYSSFGQINIPKMSNPVRESGSFGGEGGEPVGMEHTLCLGRRHGVGSLVSVMCRSRGVGREKNGHAVLVGMESAQLSWFAKLLTSLNKPSLCGQVWSSQEVVDFNYGSAEEKSELGGLERLKAGCSQPGGIFGVPGCYWAAFPACSVHQVTAHTACLGSVHFPCSYVGRQVTQKITVLSKVTVINQPLRSDLDKITSKGSASEKAFGGTVGCSSICIYIGNINGLSVPEALTAILNIPLVDQVSSLTVFNLSPSSLVQIQCLLARPPSCRAYIDINIFPFWQIMENLSKSPSRILGISYRVQRTLEVAYKWSNCFN